MSAKPRRWSLTSGNVRGEVTPPFFIGGSEVERVASFKLLAVHIKDYSLRRLRTFELSTSALCTFYRGIIESALAGSIAAWSCSGSAASRKSLRRVEKTAETLFSLVGVACPPCFKHFIAQMTPLTILCLLGTNLFGSLFALSASYLSMSCFVFGHVACYICVWVCLKRFYRLDSLVFVVVFIILG